MPNWCNNTVVFDGNENAIEQIQQVFRTMAEKEEQDNCGQLPDFIPLCDGHFFDLYENDTEVFNYQTKWSSNVEVLQKIAEHFKVGFIMDYEEIGNLIYGRAMYENGVLRDIYLEDEDFEQYKYNEENDCYHFEDKDYESDSEILETLLERKIAKQQS